MKIDNLILGRTVVKVMRKEEDQKTFREIHRGAVVQDLNAFVRVFNFEDRAKGGDHDPLCSELFPVGSKNCYVEQIGELKENQAIQIPSQFA